MQRYSIVLERNGLGGVSTNSLATDALNAISSILGTADVQIEAELKSQITITYEWIAAKKFFGTEEHLSKFNLRRV